MDEDVLAAVVRLNEAEALGLVEPFNGAGNRHGGRRIGSLTARARAVVATAAATKTTTTTKTAAARRTCLHRARDNCRSRYHPVVRQLIGQHCRQISAQGLEEPRWWRVLRSVLVFHVLRRYPAWALWLPAHQPHLAPGEKIFTTAPDP